MSKIEELVDGVTANMLQDSMPKQWHLIYRGTLYSSMVAILVIFIYASVEESKSSHWEFTDTYSTGGRFAPESWNCQIRPYFTELGSVCNSAVGSLDVHLPIITLTGS